MHTAKDLILSICTHPDGGALLGLGTIEHFISTDKEVKIIEITDSVQI